LRIAIIDTDDRLIARYSFSATTRRERFGGFTSTLTQGVA
jgi:hypothetical protein